MDWETMIAEKLAAASPHEVQRLRALRQMLVVDLPNVIKKDEGCTPEKAEEMRNMVLQKIAYFEQKILNLRSN